MRCCISVDSVNTTGGCKFLYILALDENLKGVCASPLPILPNEAVTPPADARVSVT